MVTERNKVRERTFTVFFMFTVTFVAISIVAGIHLATAATVARNEKLFLQRAVREASGMPEFDSSDQLVDWYDTCVKPVPNAEAPRFYAVQDEATGELTGYVFICEGTGLWGSITAVVGLEKNARTLAGVTFVKHNETPGLGARISEDWFKAQFPGKSGPFTLTPEATPSDSPTEMDAITGATITSRAVRDMLNGVLETAQSTVAAERADG